MILVTIAFSATEGRRDALVEKLLAILPATAAFEGCSGVTLSESHEARGDLVLTEKWESRQAYDAYKSWRAHSGTSVLGSGLVDDGSVTTRHFDVLSDSTPR